MSGLRTGKGSVQSQDRTARRIGAAVLVSQNLRRIAAQLDRDIEATSGERQSFTLFVWTEGRANCISNTSDRAAVRESILQIIADWDADQPKADVCRVQ